MTDDEIHYKTPERTVHATTDALIGMLSHPPNQWIWVKFDRCPDCLSAVEACWTPSQAATALPASTQHFTLTLRCRTCPFIAASQHRINRWRST
jgi:hypothetical protein